MSVESDIVLPKVYLGVLSENPPRSLQELEHVMRESPTRFQKYGAEIYKLIGG